MDIAKVYIHNYLQIAINFAKVVAGLMIINV